jgi:protoheme IX farnesyltransferase
MMLSRIKKYVLVAKPGIVLGNLITATGGFFVASRGCIDIAVLLYGLIGISLVVASGCVLNNVADKDLDRKMARTRNRVLAKGLMSAKTAIGYASWLGIAGTTLLVAGTNRLTVAIVLAGWTIYVGVYSLVLKRRWAYATWIGSLAGAAPPLAGYCAVSGRFDLEAWILLCIFSLWQIPHAYAIAIFRFDEYTEAGIPVLPVTQGMPAAKKRIIASILGFLAASLMLTFCGYAGYSYLAAAAALGFVWLFMAFSGYRTSNDRLWAKRLFVFSILAIVVLSAMMSIDVKLRAASNDFTALSGAPLAGPRVTARHCPPDFSLDKKAAFSHTLSSKKRRYPLASIFCLSARRHAIAPGASSNSAPSAPSVGI